MATNGQRNEDGFELNGEFFRWNVSAIGKDLMLIDRFSGLPIADFFEVVEDSFERGRAPILLTLVATSIRAAHTDWSVERIIRTVMDLSLDELVFVNVDEEEAAPGPPVSAGEEEPTGARSPSPLRSPSSEQAPATSETSNATPA